MPLVDGLGPASALPGGRSRSGEAADAMRAYYRERAPEYDLLYAVPAYQDDLATLRSWLEPHVVGASVLEVAAGTGYWTEAAAPFARAITATDCNAETLAVAARRRLGPKVTLVEADAYALPDFGARIRGRHGPFVVVPCQEGKAAGVPIRARRAVAAERHPPDARPAVPARLGAAMLPA